MKTSIVALLLAAAAGCAAAPKEPEPPRFEPVHPYRVAVALPVVDFDREALNKAPRERYSVESDPATLQEALVHHLRRRGPFAEVAPLPPGGEGEEAMGRAAQEGADLLLETRVRKRLASFLGSNSLYVPNLFVWFMAWIPSWWLKDETYALGIEVEVDLRSVHSGRSIYSGVHRVKFRDDLDDFQRGWQFLGIFRVPGSLKKGNWRRIDESLGPKAEGKLAGQVVAGIGKEVQKASGSAGFRSAFARRYAMVIGVSRFEDYRIHNLRFADRDAAAFHEHILGPGGVPAHNTRLLVNGQATLQEIRAALAEFVRRGAGEGDEILIYFAGYGAWSEGKAYILPYDADSERTPETSLPLDDLASLGKEGKGPQVTLILDAPFVTRFQGRGAEEETTGDLGEALEAFLGTPGRQVLSACEVGQGCVELEDLGHGLFTYYLLRGLQGKGDRDRDGRVTWDEAYAFADRMAGAHARLEGKVQKPALYRGITAATPEKEDEDR